MVDYQTIFQFLQTVGILVGVFYYVMTIRANQRNQQLTLKAQEHATETRQTQVFMQLYDRIIKNMDAFWEMIDRWSWTDFDDFMSKYGQYQNPEEWNKFNQVCGQFEQMGLLVRDGLISPELVWHWIGDFPIRLYEKFSSVIDEYRLQYETPPKGMWFEWFEDLAYVLKEEREKDRRDFVDRLARRTRQREALGI